MLIEKVRADRMSAMKAKDVVAKTILTTLLGELEGAAKRTQSTVTDEMVIKTSKKFIASNLEVIALGSNVDALQLENAILTGFVPVQLTADDLRDILVKANISNIGEGMKLLKTQYADLYDGKIASAVIKSII